jgi:hypothetical protein
MMGRGSLLFQGRFGRIFRALPPAEFGGDEQRTMRVLGALAEKMIAPPRPPADEPNPDESGIPAAYTYFGQFVDHDVTFDPSSSLERQNDPDGLTNYRTPRFDLDSLYGRGPDDQPYLYDDGRSFLLGRALEGGGARNKGARDLQRTKGNVRFAIIGDPRNDENVIVSQLQGLLMRFHNFVASEHPGWTFERVQRAVRFHYQWVVLRDFLPTLVSEEALSSVVPDGIETTPLADLASVPRHFFNWRNEIYMPLEFSAAAYRFGHSMVRSGYRLNEGVGPLPILGSEPNEALLGFREFPRNWAIDWSLFIDLEVRPVTGKARMQLADKIDTTVAGPLSHLPFRFAEGPASLPLRNLLRGWRLRLPSGQDVARTMGLEPLPDDQITVGGNYDSGGGTAAANIDRVFTDNCPLWTYVLAETKLTERTVNTSAGGSRRPTRQLGPVGGRIVTETILGLMQGDSTSVIAQDPTWKPFYLKEGRFGLRELIEVALAV